MGKRVVSGTKDIPGVVIYDDDILADGVIFDIAAASRLALRGDDVLLGVTVAGEGLLRAVGPLAVDDGLILQGDVVFANAASLTQNGGELMLGTADNDVTRVRNLPSATWTLTQGAGMSGTSASTFVNLGTLAVTSGETSVVSANLVDRGTLDVEGTLTLTGDINRIFGTAEGAGVIHAGFIALNGASVSTNIEMGAYNGDTDDFVRVLDDVLFTGAAMTTPGIQLVGAKLTLAGGASVGDFNDIIGQGVVVCEDQAQFDSVEFTLGDGVTLSNIGDFSMSGNLDPTRKGNAAYVTISAQAAIYNQTGATWTDATIASRYGGDGTFHNLGAFIENGQSLFTTALENDGTFTLGPPFRYNASPTLYPSLAFAGAVTGTGQIDVDVGPIETDSSVSLGQTFNLSGGDHAGLIIDDFVDFSGQLHFDPEPSTDVVNVNLKTADWAYLGFQPGGTSGTGQLAFSQANQDKNIALSGVADPTDLIVTTTNGVTTLQYKIA